MIPAANNTFTNTFYRHSLLTHGRLNNKYSLFTAFDLPLELLYWWQRLYKFPYATLPKPYHTEQNGNRLSSWQGRHKCKGNDRPLICSAQQVQITTQ